MYPHTNIKRPYKYSILILLIYVVTIPLFGVAIGFAEISQDVSMHLKLILNPLYQFTQAMPDQMQHPPLLGLAQAIFVYPFLLLADSFMAIRFGYVVMLTIAIGIFVMAVRISCANRLERIVSCVCFGLMPVVMIPTIILPQDEVLSLLMVTLLSLLLLKKRYMWFSFVCGASVVVAKIYFVVPLAIVLMSMDGRSLLRGMAAGILPILCIYLPVIVVAKVTGGVYPMQGFNPTIEFGTGIWTFLTNLNLVSYEGARRISVLIVGVYILGTIFYVRKYRVYMSDLNLIGVMASALLFVFIMFDHTNPEYFIICFPLVLLTVDSNVGKIVSSLVLSLPWFINFLFGVKGAVIRGEEAGKSVFVSLYKVIFDLGQIDFILNISLLVINTSLFVLFLFISVKTIREIQKGRLDELKLATR
jgi:hypothetical protein